jgi:hypothetical protein
MLFEPDRHEALCAADWDASRAREAIRTIVDDIECNRLVEGHWPVHPLDEEGDTPRTGFKGIYLGTAGNGYAFLKLYQRTGDSLWLERAILCDACDRAARSDAAKVRTRALHALDGRPGSCGLPVALPRRQGVNASARHPSMTTAEMWHTVPGDRDSRTRTRRGPC